VVPFYHHLSPLINLLLLISLQMESNPIKKINNHIINSKWFIEKQRRDESSEVESYPSNVEKIQVDPIYKSKNRVSLRTIYTVNCYTMTLWRAIATSHSEQNFPFLVVGAALHLSSSLVLLSLLFASINRKMQI